MNLREKKQVDFLDVEFLNCILSLTQDANDESKGSVERWANSNASQVGDLSLYSPSNISAEENKNSKFDFGQA